MKIGVFDSGVGGITVLKEALKQLPGEDYIYYADTKNVPYGPRSKEEVKQFVFDAVAFLESLGIKALLVACNTATSIAVRELRQMYSFPIVGMEPAVKPAVERSKGKRVLVTATELTLKEEKFHNLVSRVNGEGIVDPLPLPGLVEFAEGFMFDEETVITYLRKALEGFNIENYGTVVLGCTHFPFYYECFKKVFGAGVDIIDGNIGTVKYLKKLMEENGLVDGTGRGDVKFYSSGVREPQASKYHKYLELLD
ncbi:MAG: glutamate racemase [Bacillota bacterium]